MTRHVDFVLSLGEHEWTDEQTADEDAARVEALRRVREEGWRQAESEEDVSPLGAGGTEVTSIAEYRALLTERLADMLEGAPFFAEVLDEALVRLASLIESRKASLVAGWAYELEGHHNDTLFYVRLAVP